MSKRPKPTPSTTSEPEYAHTFEILYDQDTLALIVAVDGKEWGYLTLRDLGSGNHEKIEKWGARVMVELAAVMNDGKDIWAPEALDGRHDFLMKCLP